MKKKKIRSKDYGYFEDRHSRATARRKSSNYDEGGGEGGREEKHRVEGKVNKIHGVYEIPKEKITSHFVDRHDAAFT